MGLEFPFFILIAVSLDTFRMLFLGIRLEGTAFHRPRHQSIRDVSPTCMILERLLEDVEANTELGNLEVV